MKRLLKLCLSDASGSLMPVIMWFILPIISRDPRIVEGFIITYPYQFIFPLIFDTMVIAQIKHGLKTNRMNEYSRSGCLISTFLIVCVCVISIHNYGFISKILGIDQEYRELFNFSITCLGVDWIFWGFNKILQYRERISLSIIMTWAFYVTKFSALCLAAFFGIFALVSTIYTIMGILVILVCIYAFSGRMTIPSIFAIRYVLAPISSNIGTFIIYTLGIGILAREDVLAEYNFMTLVTDTFWDVAGSGTDVHTTLHITDNTFVKNRRKIFSDILASALILVTIASLFLGIMGTIPLYSSIHKETVWVMFLIEMSIYPGYMLLCCMDSYVSYIKPTALQVVKEVCGNAVRVLLGIMFIGKYTVSMAIPISDTIQFVFAIILYEKALRYDIYSNKNKEEG